MFLVCGEAVIDFFQQKDRGATGLDFAGQVAGSPLNVAIGLTRLGCAASFMTGISTDPFGPRVIAALDMENVGHEFAQRTSHPTILAFVMVKPDGHPEYAFYGHGGADFDVHLDAMPAKLPGTLRAIHIAGFPMAIEPSRTTYAGLIRREVSNRFLSLDPNIRPALMGDMDIFRDHFETLVPLVGLIKASTEDIETLYPSVDAVTIAKRWQTLSQGTIVITDGAKGAFALNNNGIVQSKSNPVKVVDAVGAGDSFMSALLAGISDNSLLEKTALAGANSGKLKEIMDWANAAAGITCTRQGANPPTRHELSVLLG